MSVKKYQKSDGSITVKGDDGKIATNLPNPDALKYLKASNIAIANAFTDDSGLDDDEDSVPVSAYTGSVFGGYDVGILKEYYEFDDESIDYMQNYPAYKDRDEIMNVDSYLFENRNSLDLSTDAKVSIIVKELRDREAKLSYLEEEIAEERSSFIHPSNNTLNASEYSPELTELLAQHDAALRENGRLYMEAALLLGLDKSKDEVIQNGMKTPYTDTEVLAAFIPEKDYNDEDAVYQYRWTNHFASVVNAVKAYADAETVKDEWKKTKSTLASEVEKRNRLIELYGVAGGIEKVKKPSEDLVNARVNARVKSRDYAVLYQAYTAAPFWRKPLLKAKLAAAQSAYHSSQDTLYNLEGR